MDEQISGQISLSAPDETLIFVILPDHGPYCLNDDKNLTSSGQLEHLLRKGSDTLIVRYYDDGKHVASRILKGARVTWYNRNTRTFDIGWREEQFLSWP